MFRKVSRIVLFIVVCTLAFSCNRPNKLYILFDRVEGLDKGCMVFCNGLNVGEVTDIDLYNGKIITEVALKNKVKIPKGASFRTLSNILTSSFIDISYTDYKDFLATGDTVSGSFIAQKLLDQLVSDNSKSVEIQKLVDTLVRVIRDKNKGVY